MIILKSEREINYMRDAGRIVAETLQEVKKAVCPSITTLELDHVMDFPAIFALLSMSRLSMAYPV